MAIILVVDDESAIRVLVCQMLRQAGYDVREAQDGLAAYNLIRELNGALDLLITDIVMPGITGAELAELVGNEYPDLKILCISAYADPESPKGHYFLAKPFTPAALRAMVEKVLAVSPSTPMSEARRLTGSDEHCRIQADLHVRLIAAEAKLDTADQE